MDQEDVNRLRLDRRLSSRRGWISPEELEEELAKLPDVSDKITPVPAAGGSASPESDPNTPS